MERTIEQNGMGEEMKAAVIYILLLLAVLPVRAQDDMEYRMEVGAGGGLMGYLGDFNGNLTKDLQPMGTVLLRYNFDTYKTMKLNVSYGKLKGNSKDVETYYPPYANNPYKVDNSLIDVGMTFEYNFLPYGTGKEYRGAKRLVPFLFGGFGATFVSLKNSEKKSVFTANVPIGIGLKYKVGDRMNVGLEWAMHFSLSDELDGVKDPYGIPSKGAFKNTDCYHTLQVTFSYSFMAKCRVCHNQDE